MVRQDSRLRSLFLLAREFKSQQLWDKAVQTLEQGLNEFPENSHLLIALADTYFKMGSLPHAHRILKQLFKTAPENGIVHHLLAGIAEKSKISEVALRHYQAALKKNAPLQLVLPAYVRFLLREQRAETALEVMEPYRADFRDHTWFVLLRTEALLKTAKKGEALRQLNLALQKKHSRPLLLKYLRIKYLSDNQEPLITYRYLKKQMAQLPDLSDRELRELEIDYLVHCRKWSDAEKKLQQYIHLSSDKLPWMRRLVLLKQVRGDRTAFEAVARIYFLGNPGDMDMARRLETHYLQNFRVEEWTELLTSTFRRHETHSGLFGYLRQYYQQKDWLKNNPLVYEDFLNLLVPLRFKKTDFGRTNIRQIPRYVFEYFCLYFNFNLVLPQPEALFQKILELRGEDARLLPFDAEDIRRVYPVWIFALHFYFIFRRISRFRISFNPDFFYQYGIALVLKLPGETIGLDVSPLFPETDSYDRDWFSRMGMQVLRWPEKLIPKNRTAGIPLFLPQDVRPVLSLIEELFIPGKKGVVHD